jgi:hypothetical protein
MPADISPILAKLDELRAAAATQSLHDTAVAAATTQRLLFRHAQSLADDPSPLDARMVDVGGSEPWRRQLLSSCAQLNFCRAVAWRHERRMAVLGADDNVAVVIALFELFAGEVERFTQAGWRAARDESQGHGVDGRTWRANFSGGAVLTIHNRLVAQRQRDQLTNNASFEFARAEDARVDAELRRRFPKVRAVDLPTREASRVPDAPPPETISVLLDAGVPPTA